MNAPWIRIAQRLLLAGICALAAVPARADWRDDAPGVRHRLAVKALPAPYATRSVSNFPTVVAQPAGRELRMPPGFSVQRFADRLQTPRVLRVAPNGDIFVTESFAGRVTVLRGPNGPSGAIARQVFASGLDRPFGIAFHPPGPDPR